MVLIITYLIGGIITGLAVDDLDPLLMLLWPAFIFACIVDDIVDGYILKRRRKEKEKKVMANAKRCDRCGKFYVVGEKSFRIRNSKVGALKVLDINGYYIIEMDLCDECVEKLDRFLKGEEVC
jgi:hypothetical protein